MHRTIPLASFLLLAACGPDSTGLRCTGPTDDSPMLGESLTVRHHDAATVQGEALTLTFAEFVNDSRCPSGVQCAWEGNAEAQITAAKSSEQPQTFSLNTNGRFQTEASYQGYVVELVDLVPYPEAGRPIAAHDYCVVLRATKP